MGSFNVACSVSQLSLNCGDPAVFIPLAEDPYSYTIGGGNHTLIYTHCFYGPIILPIFGDYNDYGTLDTRDVTLSEAELEILGLDEVSDLFGPGVKMDSGMFVHREIYDALATNYIDEWGKEERSPLMSELSLSEEFDKFIKDIEEERELWAPIFKDDNKYSISHSHRVFNFRDWPTFQKLYLENVILKGLRKNDFVNFVSFTMGLGAVNGFFFPACNGYQHGNKYMNRVLYKKALEITERDILEDEEERAKWD